MTGSFLAFQVIFGIKFHYIAYCRVGQVAGPPGVASVYFSHWLNAQCRPDHTLASSRDSLSGTGSEHRLLAVDYRRPQKARNNRQRVQPPLAHLVAAGPAFAPTPFSTQQDNSDGQQLHLRGMVRTVAPREGPPTGPHIVGVPVRVEHGVLGAPPLPSPSPALQPQPLLCTGSRGLVAKTHMSTHCTWPMNGQHSQLQAAAPFCGGRKDPFDF